MTRKLSVDVVADLGASSLRLLRRRDSGRLHMPALVAMVGQAGSTDALAWGAAADALVGREPMGVRVVRPVRGGRVLSEAGADSLLGAGLRGLDGARLSKRLRVGLVVPADLDEPGRARWARRGEALGIAPVVLLPSALASMRGLGVEASDPGPHVLIDVGSSCTQIIVVRKNETIASATIDVGGDTLVATLQRAIRARYHLAVGLASAARVLRALSGVEVVDLHGRDTRHGKPAVVAAHTTELAPDLTSAFVAIASSMHHLLQGLDPAVRDQVGERGALLVGGATRAAGLFEQIRDQTGFAMLAAEDPDSDVSWTAVRGARRWAIDGQVA